MKFLLNTTPWENGCGLATISYALSQTNLLSAKYPSFQDRVIEKLLAAFASVYCIPNISRKAILKLFQFYQHPEDQQKLWMGPLRHVLGYRNTLPMTTEEMSALCAALQLRFELYQMQPQQLPTFSQIIHPCKGYEGDKRLATVAAIYREHHWQPIVDSMSQAFRQQLLWKQGYPQLAQHSYAAITEAARARLVAQTRKFKSPKLEKAIRLKDYQRIAQMSQEQADKVDPDNGFYANIDVAVRDKDYSTLLSIYYYKPTSRNYILSKSLMMYGTGFVADLLKYYNMLPSNIEDTAHWSVTLENVIPCNEKNFCSGDDANAKKLIADGEDLYLENDSKVSPLHQRNFGAGRFPISCLSFHHFSQNQRGFC